MILLNVNFSKLREFRQLCGELSQTIVTKDKLDEKEEKESESNSFWSVEFHFSVEKLLVFFLQFETMVS